MLRGSEHTENTRIAGRLDHWRYPDSCGTAELGERSGFPAMPGHECSPGDDEKNKAGRLLQLRLRRKPRVHCSVEQPVPTVQDRRENAAQCAQAWLGFPR